VKLAGGQLQRQAPDEWLRAFDVRKLKLKRQGDIHDSLEATFRISLDGLSVDTRGLYAGLAIFKEDEAIHEAGIKHLWQALGAYRKNKRYFATVTVRITQSDGGGNVVYPACFLRIPSSTFLLVH
jgi:hypothetical protein